MAEEEIRELDLSEQLTPAQVKQYAENRQNYFYNHGSILLVDTNLLDELVIRSIITQDHRYSAIRLRTLRDCAIGNTSGRIYNSTEGSTEQEMDPLTQYTRLMKSLTKKQRDIITNLVLRDHFSETLFGLLCDVKPDVHDSFDTLSFLLDNIAQVCENTVHNKPSLTKNSGQST